MELLNMPFFSRILCFSLTDDNVDNVRFIVHLLSRRQLSSGISWGGKGVHLDDAEVSDPVKPFNPPQRQPTDTRPCPTVYFIFELVVKLCSFSRRLCLRPRVHRGSYSLSLSLSSPPPILRGRAAAQGCRIGAPGRRPRSAC